MSYCLPCHVIERQHIPAEAALITIIESERLGAGALIRGMCFTHRRAYQIALKILSGEEAAE